MPGQLPVSVLNYWNLGNPMSQWQMSFWANGIQYGNQIVPGRQYYGIPPMATPAYWGSLGA